MKQSKKTSNSTQEYAKQKGFGYEISQFHIFGKLLQSSEGTCCLLLNKY